MELRGEYTVAAPMVLVWDCLISPEVLRASIPGCLSLDGSVADGFAAKVRIAVGPIKATFDGAVSLSNLDAPRSCTITGQGQGGIAGFARGDADVTLEETADGTIIRYHARALVGGKLAQLGGRLIEATANKLAGEFFATLAKEVAARALAPEDAP